MTWTPLVAKDIGKYALFWVDVALHKIRVQILRKKERMYQNALNRKSVVVKSFVIFPGSWLIRITVPVGLYVTQLW